MPFALHKNIEKCNSFYNDGERNVENAFDRDILSMIFIIA